MMHQQKKRPRSSIPEPTKFGTSNALKRLKTSGTASTIAITSTRTVPMSARLRAPLNRLNNLGARSGAGALTSRGGNQGKVPSKSAVSNLARSKTSKAVLTFEEQALLRSIKEVNLNVTKLVKADERLT